jgi:hypothetical protein
MKATTCARMYVALVKSRAQVICAARSASVGPREYLRRGNTMTVDAEQAMPENGKLQ